MSRVTLAKVISNFVKRALFPFLGLREPENPTLEIERSALPAQGFLTANFHQPVHALTLLCVKPFPGISVAESRTQRLTISVHIATQNEAATLPVHCSRRSATSSEDHQLVICDRDDIRFPTILTIVAQRAAAIREKTF